MAGNKGFTISVGVIVALFSLSITAHAGWVMVERNGDTALVSKGKVKASSEDMITLMDGAKSELIFVDRKNKTYSQGTVNDFCNALSELFNMMMQGLPAEQRKMMEQMMKEKEKRPLPEVKVTDEGSGGTIAGFKTIKYKVTVDGKLFEEIWLATDSALIEEIKPLVPILQKFSKCSRGIGMETGPENSPEYLKLMEKGWEVKSLNHHGGTPEIDTDLVKLEKKNIPDSEFRVPSGYKKISYSELLASQMESQ